MCVSDFVWVLGALGLLGTRYFSGSILVIATIAANAENASVRD